MGQLTIQCFPVHLRLFRTLVTLPIWKRNGVIVGVSPTLEPLIGANRISQLPAAALWAMGSTSLEQYAARKFTLVQGLDFCGPLHSAECVDRFCCNHVHPLFASNYDPLNGGKYFFFWTQDPSGQTFFEERIFKKGVLPETLIHSIKKIVAPARWLRKLFLEKFEFLFLHKHIAPQSQAMPHGGMDG